MAEAQIPNPDEVATLAVGGRKFDDWTSVMVQHRYAEAFALFRFSAVEREDGPRFQPGEGALRFRPGEECAIYLGGVLAIIGVITVRQVAYDGGNHGVQLQGKGVTWYASRSSIIDETGSYDGQSFEQIARQVIAPFGVGVKTIGRLDETPFARLQIEPGEKLWDALERIARPRGIILGSDHLGNLLLIGEHTTQVDDRLIEGENILRCQCVASIEEIHSDYLVRAQSPASDEHYGAEASRQEATVSGTLKRYSPLLTTAEQPVWSQAEVRDRARNEAIWHEGTTVQAVIAVQGWKRSNGDLWRAGNNIHIQSPMALLDQEMSIQSATFAQESGSGTITTLECCPPFLLRGRSSFNVDREGIAQDPTSYETATPAAAATSVPEPSPINLPS